MHHKGPFCGGLKPLGRGTFLGILTFMGINEPLGTWFPLGTRKPKVHCCHLEEEHLDGYCFLLMVVYLEGHCCPKYRKGHQREC